jgi:hypothetical protein
MKLKLHPGTYAEYEVEGTPAEVAEFVRALGKEPPAPLPISIPSVFVPLDVCPLGDGVHRYPAVWLSVSPPTCEKCGMPGKWVQPQWTVTWDSCLDQKNPMPPCSTETVQVGSFSLPAGPRGPLSCTD